MRIIQEQKLEPPVLCDAAIEAVNKHLKRAIWWLDQCFGQAARLTRPVGGRNYIEPCVFTGRDNQYETVMPSADLGNYSFFLPRGGVAVQKNGIIRAPFSFIVWCNVDKCFSADMQRQQRNIELLKAELIQAISDAPLRGIGTGLEIETVYDEPKKVFEGFTINETDNFFGIHPYACFRIDGIFNLIMPCDI